MRLLDCALRVHELLTGGTMRFHELLGDGTARNLREFRLRGLLDGDSLELILRSVVPVCQFWFWSCLNRGELCMSPDEPFLLRSCGLISRSNLSFYLLYHLFTSLLVLIDVIEDLVCLRLES